VSEYKVVNPATNLLEREFPAATDAEIEQVLDRSARAYQSWRTTAKDERTKVLQRVAELYKERIDDLAALMPSGAPPIALFRVLAHNPRILSRFRAGRLLDAGALSARERELLILRVSHRCDCDYEWSVHVAGFADAAGLAEADLHATLQLTAEAPLSRRERLMLTAADELVDARNLTSATTAALRRSLVPAEIVELIALVGRYMWVSMIANTAALPRELGVRPWTGSIN